MLRFCQTDNKVLKLTSLRNFAKTTIPFLLIYVRVQSILWQPLLSGVSSYFTVSIDRLIQVRLGDWPAGLEPPRMEQKQEKICCENTTKRPIRSIATPKNNIPYLQNLTNVAKFIIMLNFVNLKDIFLTFITF